MMKAGRFFAALAASALLAASFSLAACGDGHDHIDQNRDGKCDLCGEQIGSGTGTGSGTGGTQGNWAWKYEGDYHWQEDKESHAERSGSRGLHCDDDKNGECDVCGAPVKIEEEGGDDDDDDDPSADPGDDGTVTIHYHNMNGWTSVNAYSWDKATVTKYLGEWSGKPATNDGANWWSITYEIPAGQSTKDLMIIFNDAGAGGGGKTQTGDIDITGKVYGGQSWISKDEQPYPTLKAALKAESGVSGPHEHSYSTAWDFDENSHWHPSSCEHTGLRKDEEAHTYEGDKCVCSVCGYVKEHTHVQGGWVTNTVSHWRNCILCGQKIEGTEAAHSGLPCDICGYDVAVSGGLKFEYDKATDSYFVIGYDNDEIESDFRIPAEYNQKKVTAITNKAFMGCEKIHSVIIPDSVTCIDIYAFCNCANLASVSLGGGVKEIGMAAFENCSALTGIVFPESLTKIGISAFENTSVTQFMVGANLVEIGAFAFRTKKLDAVTFEVTAGWTVSNLPFSEESEAVDVSNAEKNALMFFYAKFQEDYPTTGAIIAKWAEDHGSDVLKFLSNYTWKRG